jgi:small subunit ribosomal protein S16
LPTVIRLARVGRKKICRYRLVVADHRMKRDGRFIEIVGTYNPQATPRQFTVNADRVAYWIGQGAQPSPTVKDLLKQDRFAQKIEAKGKGVDTATIQRKADRTHIKKKRVKATEAGAAPATAAAPAAAPAA